MNSDVVSVCSSCPTRFNTDQQESPVPIVTVLHLEPYADRVSNISLCRPRSSVHTSALLGSSCDCWCFSLPANESVRGLSDAVFECTASKTAPEAAESSSCSLAKLSVSETLLCLSVRKFWGEKSEKGMKEGAGRNVWAGFFHSTDPTVSPTEGTHPASYCVY